MNAKEEFFIQTQQALLDKLQVEWSRIKEANVSMEVKNSLFTKMAEIRGSIERIKKKDAKEQAKKRREEAKRARLKKLEEEAGMND